MPERLSREEKNFLLMTKKPFHVDSGKQYWRF